MKVRRSMQYGNTQYEERIDLLAVIGEAMRKWKLLVIAILVGFALFGLYKGVLSPQKVNNSEIEKLQAANDENKASITANEEEIKTNEATIDENLKSIAANEEQLKIQRASQTTLGETLDSLLAGLAQSQAVLEDPEATVEQTAPLIVQLPALTNEIAAINSELEALAQEILSEEEMNASLLEDNEALTSRNEALEKSNTTFKNRIATREKKMEELTNKGPGIKSVFSSALIGGVLGAFVFCVYIFLRYLLNNKLRTSAELKARYQLHVLGEFYSEDVSSHNRFEKLVDRFTGNFQTLPEESQVYELIAAGVQTPAAPLPVQLLVTGTVDEATIHSVGDRLCTLLPDDYVVTVAANPVYNAALLANLKQYTVLLVEAKGLSDKREIDKLAEVMSRNDVKAIGVVVK